jgi:membrane fusion protein (multidrug efflux system)
MVAIVFVGAWVIWATQARVTLYETSELGRVEADQSATEIQAELTGRVAVTRLAIGKEVRAGDVLVELDAEPQRLELSQTQATVDGLRLRKTALLSQIAVEQRARDREREASATQEAEARASAQRDEAIAQFATNEQTRMNALRAQRLASVSDSERTARDARQAQAEVTAQGIAVERLQREQVTREADRDARLGQLGSTMRDFDAQEGVAKADLARLRYEIERRKIRAPLDGRIADAEILTPGSVVTQGERLGMLVPAGKLRIIAHYAPVAAGRIQVGQSARLRLDGFPWTQYGSIRARVTAVATELRDSTLRVELAVAGPVPPAVPLQHGLPGRVDVDVDLVTPLQLVMRELGGLVTRRLSAQSP